MTFDQDQCAANANDSGAAQLATTDRTAAHVIAPWTPMYLDHNTPPGLFWATDETTKALVFHSGSEPYAIFLSGKDLKFRCHKLGHEKLLYGRWFPLEKVVPLAATGLEPHDDVGAINIAEGLARMAAVWPGGQLVWTIIGVSHDDEFVLESYDVYAVGLETPFASRRISDKHETAPYSAPEPLITTLQITIA